MLVSYFGLPTSFLSPLRAIGSMGYWQQGQGSTSRKRCTLTRPATEQTPEIPANEEAAKMTFLSSYDIDIDIGDEELEKIAALLLWMAKDFPIESR